MMLILVLMCAVLAGSLSSQAQPLGFGAGVIAGEPTGLSAKYWTSNRMAVDAALAYSFRRNGHIHLHADYLWHFSDAAPGPERFMPFVGLGGRLAGGRKEGVLGLRMVGGLGWYPRNSPLEVFLEIAPIVDIIPATEFSANGGVGIRFYF